MSRHRVAQENGRFVVKAGARVVSRHDMRSHADLWARALDARVPRRTKGNPMGDHLGEPRRAPEPKRPARRPSGEFDLASDLYATQAAYTRPPNVPAPRVRRR